MKPLFACLALLTLCFGQATPRLVSVHGTITDFNGAVFANVRVELSTSTGENRTTLTDGRGRYAFSGVTPGKYVLRATPPGDTGFSTTERQIKLRHGSKRIDIELKLSFTPQPRPTLALLYAHIQQLAGSGAKNCGNVKARGNPQRVTNCALKTFAKRQPFYLSYQMMGIDSTVAVGVIYDSAGRAFGADFDSMGWDTSDLPKDWVASNGNHIITYPCPLPIQFRTTQSGRVSCFPPSSEKKNGGLMSPTFESY